jgi:hypothetical protein
MQKGQQTIESKNINFYCPLCFTNISNFNLLIVNKYYTVGSRYKHPSIYASTRYKHPICRPREGCLYRETTGLGNVGFWSDIEKFGFLVKYKRCSHW